MSNHKYKTYTIERVCKVYEISLFAMICTIKRFIPQFKGQKTFQTGAINKFIALAQKLDGYRKAGKHFTIVFDRNGHISGVEYMSDKEIDGLKCTIQQMGVRWTVTTDDENPDQLRLYFLDYFFSGYDQRFAAPEICRMTGRKVGVKGKWKVKGEPAYDEI